MKTFYRYIFFTRAPLQGYFRCDDLFQVYPVQIEGTPDSSIKKHFANFIEFYTTEEDNVKLETPYPEMDDIISRNAPPIIKQDMFLSILTTGTNHLFFRYEDFTGFWGISVFSENSEDYAGLSSKWCFPFYGSDELVGTNVIHEFSELHMEPVERVRHTGYFFGGISPDKEYSRAITIPTNLKAFIEAYFLLRPDDRIIINNAMLHLKNGVELRDAKKTLALLSLFTCLETMVDLETKGFDPKRCESCNQLVFSISKRFRDFLTKYVSSHKTNKRKFNDLYSLRSKIVHTGKTLKSERLFAEIPQEERKSEELQVIEVAQICRVAITNWVIKNAKEDLAERAKLSNSEGQ